MLAQVHFYRPTLRPVLGVALWSLALRPMFTHTTLSIQDCILWDQLKGEVGGWYDHGGHVQTRPPTLSIPVLLPASLGDVERAARLVAGWRTNKAGSALCALTGWPSFPRNCTTSVCLLLTAMGFPVVARTPDEMYGALIAKKLERPARPVR